MMAEKTQCDICEMILKKDSFKIVYEDDEMIAMLHEAPAFLGHTLLIPRQHFRILEEVPEKVFSNMFNMSNTISTALFESLNIHGTNILINNGPEAGQNFAHFMINIIPRTDSDGINMEWIPSKADNIKLENTYHFLKTYVEKAILGDFGEPRKIVSDEKVIEPNKDDYMTKQLHRMP
jgi:histidine triad (HIT) family protein